MTEQLKTISIKGFNTDLKCRDFQFELGQTYEIAGNVKACKSGFHACPVEFHPLTVFQYYPPAGSRFAEVEQFGDTDSDDNKLASAKITIGVEITLHQLITRAVKWVFERAKPEGETATGDGGAASSTGLHSVALGSGYQSKAMAGETSAICLVHRNDDGEIVAIRASKVGENGVKPLAWYSLSADGEFVEIDQSEAKD